MKQIDNRINLIKKQENTITNNIKKQPTTDKIIQTKDKADSLYREIAREEGQVLLLKKPLTDSKLKSIQKDIKDIKTAKTKTQAKQAHDSALSKVKTHWDYIVREKTE